VINKKYPPRFEFRTFGHQLDEPNARMAQLSDPVPAELHFRKSAEIYIVSLSIDSDNIKIRNNIIDIKRRLQRVGKLEQWNPVFKAAFPLSVSDFERGVAPVLGLANRNDQPPELTLDQFLELIENSSGLETIAVEKERKAYSLNNTICEVAEIRINRTTFITICVESTDIEDIHETINQVGLTDYENINYPEAIKRINGMVDKPLPT